MPLGDIYRNAIGERYEYPRGWLINWPPSFDRRLGMVGSVVNGMFNRSGELGDYGVTAEADPTPATASGAWDYTSTKSISVVIKADASAPGWSWIKNAKAGVKVGFSNEEGLVLSIGSTSMESLRDLDGLKRKLIDAAKAGSLDGDHAVIVEQQLATNGLSIVSEGHSGELSATTNVDVAPGGQSLAAFAADFHLNQKSEAITNQSFPNGFTVAFRVVKLGRRGWLWWRHWDVDMRAIDREAALDDDEYFALFPGQ